MLNLFNMVNLFGDGITDPHAVIEAAVDRNVDVPGNGRTQHGTTMATIMHRQITASADKTNSQGSPTNNHGQIRPESFSQELAGERTIPANVLELSMIGISSAARIAMRSAICDSCHPRQR